MQFVKSCTNVIKLSTPFLYKTISNIIKFASSSCQIWCKSQTRCSTIRFSACKLVRPVSKQTFWFSLEKRSNLLCFSGHFNCVLLAKIRFVYIPAPALVRSIAFLHMDTGHTSGIPSCTCPTQCHLCSRILLTTELDCIHILEQLVSDFCCWVSVYNCTERRNHKN